MVVIIRRFTEHGFCHFRFVCLTRFRLRFSWLSRYFCLTVWLYDHQMFAYARRLLHNILIHCKPSLWSFNDERLQLVEMCFFHLAETIASKNMKCWWTLFFFLFAFNKESVCGILKVAVFANAGLCLNNMVSEGWNGTQRTNKILQAKKNPI